jgi:GDP-L-fucose synthase
LEIINTNQKIFVAGHQGMVGSAIVRKLEGLSGAEIISATRDELDLCSQQSVTEWIAHSKPDQIYLAAAKVGGIHANEKYPAEFIYENIMIEANIIHASYVNEVKRLMFLGSSCIYPKYAPQPIKEDSLLTGNLEPTNEPYAIAKIAGLKLCESYSRQYGCDFRSVMPTNLYGPNDNYHSENSHVIPSLIGRIHEAKISNAEEVIIWGTGTPRREFLYVDDLATACIHTMNLDRNEYESITKPLQSHINVGSGTDCTIRELAEAICHIIGFKGRLSFDASRQDGTPRKLIDSSKLHSLGWKPEYDLEAGLIKSYEWYKSMC